MLVLDKSTPVLLMFEKAIAKVQLISKIVLNLKNPSVEYLYSIPVQYFECPPVAFTYLEVTFND